MHEFEFVRPGSLDELKSLLLENEGRIVAGGTDVVPKMRRKLFPTGTLVDINDLQELKFIREQGDVIEIGALTTHQEIVQSPLLQEYNPALVAAAATVGCDQTRNLGTLGGNIANASPAADSLPALLVYDTRVRLVGQSGERFVGLQQLISGPGQIDLASGEFIYSVLFDKLNGAWGSVFLKQGKRSGMAISVANAAAAVVLDANGAVEELRLALGSVAPTVVRCSAAEESLRGKTPTPESMAQAAASAAQHISPISDIRATQAYRRQAAIVLAERAIALAVSAAASRSA